MKNIFKPGDVKNHRFVVKEADVAAFGVELVHNVCSTFTLAREMEFTSRLFIQEVKEEDEEGIGSGITIEHQAPALPGEELVIESKLEEIRGNTLFCSVEVRVGNRLVASGTTEQKVLKKSKIIEIFENLRKGGGA